MSSNITIKNWALEDRPREKMLYKGSSALSDAELLAILIGSGTRKESAVELSRKILAEANNNLPKLGKLSVDELVKKFKGIGPAKAITIVAALELGKRRNLHEVSQTEKITSSKDVYKLFQPVMADLNHEEFWVLYMNRSNKIISKRRLSQGGVSGTVIDPRLVFKPGLEVLASSVILCHNHPSGNNSPSDADIQITKKLKKAGEVLDISVLDHLIICESSYYSMADEGII
ncbi:DNA repair protein RadC [Saccharicrinis sp. FJH2]|uniref:RadC family protein n=1 Tax=unclassified Saccharicrinis TaxID=2646859 RepID=UPI0035D4A274